jgi:hypothetical protein
MKLIALATCFCLLVQLPVAQAQSGGSGGSQTKAQSPPSSSVDVDKLPVSVVRIRRTLEETPPLDPNSSLLRLNYYVDVYGQFSPIDLFADVDLSPGGPIQYGGMTHAEFLQMVTPQEFRSPVMDFSGAIYALTNAAIKKRKEKREEEERRRIQAEAQRLRQP